MRSHPKYNRATTTSTAAAQGTTTYTCTGPGGASVSVTFSGFADDMLIGDLNNDGEDGDAAFAMSQNDAVTVVLLNGPLLGVPVSYAVGIGSAPRKVAAGDLDGDGFVDLITANSGTNTLSFLRGADDGTFGTPSTLNAGSQPQDVALGDFDEDGNLDFAVADSSGSQVIVRLGSGGGVFGPEIPIATAQLAYGLEVVDMNSDIDTHDDIVTNGSILLGNGDGTFGAPVDIARGYFASGVEIADTNGDGHPDILLGNFNNSLVTILTGRGDGTVDPPQHYVSASGPEATTFADFDGDGIEDLIVTNGGDSGTIMGGRGDGTFRWVRGVPTGPAGQFSGAEDAAVADFTGDAIPDIAVANGGNVVIIPGSSGGELGLATAIPGQNGSRVASGHWDGDSCPDLALVGTATGLPRTLNVLPGLGGGAFGPATSIALPAPSHAQNTALPMIVTAFLNSDTFPDLLLANFASGNISIFLGMGDGSFAEQSPVEIHTAPMSTYTFAPEVWQSQI
ncbi:MAG: VCBS repeat-containing protein [Verrucomicrobiales bacterium]